MDILNRTYTTAEIAELVGVSVKDLANWADRGLIRPVNESIGRGRSREYSWFTLIQIACGVAIMELGFSSPKEALAAALRFAHISSGGSGWVGSEQEGQPIRYPGLPFHHMRGVTMFYVSGERGAVLLHRIWDKELFSDGHFKLERLLNGARGYIALNVSEIFEDLCARLGEDYRNVLDRAYAGKDEAVNWTAAGGPKD